MDMKEYVDLSHRAARALNSAPRAVAFGIRDRLVKEVEALVSRGEPLSPEVADFIDRYGAERPTSEVAAPTVGRPEPPLTPNEIEALYIEIVLGIPESKSQVPNTAESRKLRASLTEQVEEAKAKGYMLMIPN